MTEQEITTVSPNEINQFKGQISAVVESAQRFTITTEEDLQTGADLLHTIKSAEDVVKKRKEEITRPLMSSLASARDLFKPFESACEDARKIIKKKIVAFQVAEHKRIEDEKRKIATKVEQGKMKGTTAIKKLENVGEVKTSAAGSTGSIQTRTLTKVRIVNVDLIPREYLIPDTNKITEAVLRAGIEIPGVEKYTEKVIASR